MLYSRQLVCACCRTGIHSLDEWQCSAAPLDCCLCPCCGPCSAILLPIVVTFYVTYHFLQLFDGIFSVRLLLEMQQQQTLTVLSHNVHVVAHTMPAKKPASWPDHMLLSQPSAGGLSWGSLGGNQVSTFV